MNFGGHLKAAGGHFRVIDYKQAAGAMLPHKNWGISPLLELVATVVLKISMVTPYDCYLDVDESSFLLLSSLSSSEFTPVLSSSQPMMSLKTISMFSGGSP